MIKWANFWKNLIVKKTEILGEVTINLQMEKIEKERNENAKNEKMLSIVKGIFGKGKNKENENNVEKEDDNNENDK